MALPKEGFGDSMTASGFSIPCVRVKLPKQDASAAVDATTLENTGTDSSKPSTLIKYENASVTVDASNLTTSILGLVNQNLQWTGVVDGTIQCVFWGWLTGWDIEEASGDSGGIGTRQLATAEIHVSNLNGSGSLTPPSFTSA